jgi:hypothetical protein
MATAHALPRIALAILPWVVPIAACSGSEISDPGPGSTNRDDARDAGADRGCDAGSQARGATPGVDKVDLLFMVDNSGSMKEEQAALRAQFPRLIRALTTGDIDDDGIGGDFAPATDLHLGVVSSDIGLAGVTNAASLNCPAAGDDGRLLHAAMDPLVQGCKQDYPTFLTYQTPDSDPEMLAKDFGCIASLGTKGCGFEQQLEAALKALWPSRDGDGMPNMAPTGGPFLADAETDAGASSGHGDGANEGFLRNDVAAGTSLIAIVLVTDEEDCSSANTHHFTPSADLPSDDPLRRTMYFEHPNLRCFENKANLWPIERYVEGFKALRPGQDERVMFAAIAGVPPRAVDASALAAVDFSDAQQRERFYAGILNSPEMTETVDPATATVRGSGNLRPSCQSARGVAYPPRRIVEVARGFGANGVVQSICDDDLGQAVDAITSMIARQLREGKAAQPADPGSCD